MDDVRFVQRCCSGEKPAWEEFLARYSRLIYNYILSVGRTYGVELPAHDVDEVFQSVILLLLKNRCKNLKSYQGRNGCSFATWLRMVVVRQAVSFLRLRRDMLPLEEERQTQSAAGPQEVSIGSGGSGIVDEHPGSGLNNLLRDERSVALTECIKRLAREDRYFIQLHLYAGMSLDLLKDHLRITRAAVDMRKTRLLRQLRDCFAGKGFLLDSAV